MVPRKGRGAGASASGFPPPPPPPVALHSLSCHVLCRALCRARPASTSRRKHKPFTPHHKGWPCSLPIVSRCCGSRRRGRPASRPPWRGAGPRGPPPLRRRESCFKSASAALSVRVRARPALPPAPTRSLTSGGGRSCGGGAIRFRPIQGAILFSTSTKTGLSAPARPLRFT